MKTNLFITDLNLHGMIELDSVDEQCLAVHFRRALKALGYSEHLTRYSTTIARLIRRASTIMLYNDHLIHDLDTTKFNDEWSETANHLTVEIGRVDHTKYLVVLTTCGSWVDSDFTKRLDSIKREIWYNRDAMFGKTRYSNYQLDDVSYSFITYDKNIGVYMLQRGRAS